MITGKKRTREEAKLDENDGPMIITVGRDHNEVIEDFKNGKIFWALCKKDELKNLKFENKSEFFIEYKIYKGKVIGREVVGLEELIDTSYETIIEMLGENPDDDISSIKDEVTIKEFGPYYFIEN